MDEEGLTKELGLYYLQPSIEEMQQVWGITHVTISLGFL